MSKTNSNKKHQTSLSRFNQTDNCRVVVRVRPLFPRYPKQPMLSTVTYNYQTIVSKDQQSIIIVEYFNHQIVQPNNLQEYAQDPNNYTQHQFSFDRVYDEGSTQEEVYRETARESVVSMLQGFNSTIMAYGQTGTGKTFTMQGFKYNSSDPQRGIIPRTIQQIFAYIQNSADQLTKFMVRVSYLQIYNQNISDLLRTQRTNLQIRQDKKRGVYVQGLSQWAVRSPNQIFSLLMKGAASRKTAYTNMNDHSSRSHSIFLIIVQQMKTQRGNSQLKAMKVGKLNLVDLAGSQRVRVTGATGTRLQQSKKINQSLSYLGNVVAALTDQKIGYVNYRDTKITRILQDSLGGNCKTTMIAMISPGIQAFSQSLSSLKFAYRAKKIKNRPTVNQDVDQKALIRKYQVQLRKLRTQLDERSKTLIDRSKVSQLQEQKRKIQHDKNKAIAALQQRNRAFQNERYQKKKLQQKIRSINSQMILGGNKIQDTPQFRSALAHQQQLLRRQYQNRMSKLQQQREQIISSKNESQQSKGLLLKQRDIMIVLSQKLNQRDECINQLQQQLDVYDNVYRQKELNINQQQKRIVCLENILRINKIPIPENNLKKENVVYYEGHEIYNLTNKPNVLKQNKNNKEEREKDNSEKKLKEATKLIDKLIASLSNPKATNNTNIASQLLHMHKFLHE